MIAFYQWKGVLIATFLKSEIGPLADTSLYVDWLSPQWSPNNPTFASPVQWDQAMTQLDEGTADQIFKLGRGNLGAL